MAALAILSGAAYAMLPAVPPPQPIEVDVTKWLDDHRAAIAITYDIGRPSSTPYVQEMVRAHGLALDFELVSGQLTPDKERYIKEELIPQGFGFFGHGHEHSNHDEKGAQWAYQSAKKCYDAMVRLGLKPVAFAYPGGAGSRKATHNALRKAHFISARGHDVSSKPYNMPGDLRRPKTWYKLRDVWMESIKYRHKSSAVNNTRELKRYLKGAVKQRAWIILTYHAIGLEDEFGFYEREDFATDLDAIVEQDMWSASINAITLYVRERQDIKLTATQQNDRWGAPLHISLQLDDGRPDDVFDQPLTVRFAVPAAWQGKQLVVSSEGKEVARTSTTESTALVNLRPIDATYRVQRADDSR